jgi:hypothetical protein
LPDTVRPVLGSHTVMRGSRGHRNERSKKWVAASILGSDEGSRFPPGKAETAGQKDETGMNVSPGGYGPDGGTTVPKEDGSGSREPVESTNSPAADEAEPSGLAAKGIGAEVRRAEASVRFLDSNGSPVAVGEVGQKPDPGKWTAEGDVLDAAAASA